MRSWLLTVLLHWTSSSFAKSASLPWGPGKIGGPCPVPDYRLQNETKFCKSVGKQRAIAIVQETRMDLLEGEKFACVALPWRRFDNPRQIGIYVLSAKNATAIPYLPAGVIGGDNINGTVCFALDGSGMYAIYYLPFAWSFDAGSGSYHSHFLDNASAAPVLPPSIASDPHLDATFVHFESYTNFDERTSMEFAASEAELAALQAAAKGKEYLTWVSFIHNTTEQTPRSRFLPQTLALQAPNISVTLEAAVGSIAVVQVVLLASKASINGVSTRFQSVGDIPANSFSCFQTSGVDYRGNAMVPPDMKIPLGQVGHLLVSIQIPATLSKGETHTGAFFIKPEGMAETKINVSINVAASKESSGLDLTDVWRLERLAWLNSRVGIEESLITAPYSALSLQGHILTCRGRTIAISSTGLPEAITSNGRDVLAGPGKFLISTETSIEVQWSFSPVQVSLGPGNATASWSTKAVSQDQQLLMQVEGSLEYDGYLNFGVSLQALHAVHLTDALLKLELPDAISRFANGAGFGDDGDWFPKANASLLNWRWSEVPGVDPHAPAGDPVRAAGWRLWVGDVDAGLFLKLKGTDLGWNRAKGGDSPPSSWSNSGIGGINVTFNSNVGTTVLAFSGARDLGPNEILIFNFTLLATPVKGDFLYTFEAKHEHYEQMRHYHVPYGQWDPPAASSLHQELGTKVVILHQSNRLNPYIDWPFHPTVMPKLQEYVNDATGAGTRVKMYYTVSQLSNHAVELFALAGMNGEILLRNSSDKPVPPGKLGGMGGNLMGNEWLEEHMVTGYEGGWFTLNPGGDEDASIGDNTTSRFLNYYIEGQRWLFDKIGIGGLYYDGFSGERFVQQRIRRMTTPKSSNSSLLPPWYDVHGRAFQNTELLPFVDSMWTCEGIDFTKSPAYWLISISALPFGTFGEMLGADNVLPVPGKFCGESCANKWRGMLFGMSNRAGWTGHDPNDNAGLWRLWDDFGIVHAHMYGWWNSSCPVSIGSNVVFASAYVRAGHSALVALASWSSQPENVTLQINWSSLGLDPKQSELVAPLLPSFNHANSTIVFSSDKPISIPALKGWLLLIRPKTSGTLFV